jgi:predicted ArsR family transcriptional regulator
VDRLSLFKVLADRSRYAVFQEVTRADEPISTADVAARLDLHPNTVRLHLEKLREVGLVTISSDRHGSVGRPQHLWAAVAQAPSLGLEPAGFRVLAHLLAELAAEGPLTGSRIVDVGRRQGRERANRSATRPGRPGPACEEAVQAVMDQLADLGFDPALDMEDGGGQAYISFARCPFRELAALYPDLVCQLHRGVTEGLLATAVAATPGVEGQIESFGSLVDTDPCRVELSVHA